MHIAWVSKHSAAGATAPGHNLQGIQMKSRGPKFDGVLRALIAKLERDKPAAGLGDGDKEYCRNFAESIFARADKIDRAGRADKGTCLTFYAATIFIEVWVQTCCNIKASQDS